MITIKLEEVMREARGGSCEARLSIDAGKGGEEYRRYLRISSDAFAALADVLNCGPGPDANVKVTYLRDPTPISVLDVVTDALELLRKVHIEPTNHNATALACARDLVYEARERLRAKAKKGEA